jgi:hypothetical protein
MTTEFASTKPNLTVALDLVIAAFDDDVDRGNEIYATANGAELVIGLVGVAKLLSLSGNGDSSDAARDSLIELRRSMEIDQIFGEM